MTNILKAFAAFFLCSVLLSSCNLLDEPITKKEAITFGKQIEKSFVDKNPALFNDIIDVRTFADRIEDVAKGKISRSQLATLPETIRKRQLGSEILQLNGKDGTYEVVKQYEKDKKQHLLFRLYGANGLNYHDIELVRRGDKLKAADIYVYMSGETFSKSVADVMVEMNNYYDKKPDEEKVGIETMREIRKLMRSQNLAEAKKKYDNLPEVFKKQKAFQLINVMITSDLDQDQYKDALTKYAASFPNEPNMYLVMIDNHVLQKNYTAALSDINQLDSLINKDPFLDFYRGNIYSAMDETENAITSYERLHKNLPHFDDGVVELTALYLKSKQEDKAHSLVKESLASKEFDKDKLSVIKILYPQFNF